MLLLLYCTCRQVVQPDVLFWCQRLRCGQGEVVNAVKVIDEDLDRHLIRKARRSSFFALLVQLLSDCP